MSRICHDSKTKYVLKSDPTSIQALFRESILQYLLKVTIILKNYSFLYQKYLLRHKLKYAGWDIFFFLKNMIIQSMLQQIRFTSLFIYFFW